MKINKINKKSYDNSYNKKEFFLRYPSESVIRFYNLYLKENKPSGVVLDYGCGGGNNSKFFLDKGYNVYGCDISKNVVNLINENIEDKKNFKFNLLSLNNKKLPYKDKVFDIIISNQVLYYIPDKDDIQNICKEFNRCLKKDGIVYFTMMGTKNYYIKKYSKKEGNSIYEVKINDKNHKLCGLHEIIYAINNKKELKDLFSIFKLIDIGYWELNLESYPSNFHWVFIGEKK